MGDLLSTSCFTQALAVLAVAGMIMSGVFWFIGRKNTETSVKSRVYVILGCIPLLVYLLWQLDQKVLFMYGLDSIKGLCILVVTFCIIGALGAAAITAAARHGK